MPERTERLTQRIPAGVLSPTNQFALAGALVREVGGVLVDSRGFTPIEAALADVEKSCITLATAGVLVGLGLTFREGEEVCGAVILLDQDGVGDAEQVDFSALRLLVGTEATPSLEIICADCALSRKLVDRLLPSLAAETLAVAQIRWQAEASEVDLLAEENVEEDEEEEDVDGNDDESEGWD